MTEPEINARLAAEARKIAEARRVSSEHDDAGMSWAACPGCLAVVRGGGICSKCWARMAEAMETRR